MVCIFQLSNCKTFFAIDNIDFTEDTLDGRNTLHGTVLVAFQQIGEHDIPVHPFLQVEASGVSTSLKNLPNTIVDLLPCTVKGNPKPKTNLKPKHFKVSTGEVFLQEPEQQDMTWHNVRSVSRSINQQSKFSNVLSEINDADEDTETSIASIKDTDIATNEKVLIPAWAGYNSLICQVKDHEH